MTIMELMAAARARDPLEREYRMAKVRLPPQPAGPVVCRTHLVRNPRVVAQTTEEGPA
jgi:hypothetical protein